MDAAHQLEAQPSKRTKMHGNFNDVQHLGQGMVRSAMDAGQEAFLTQRAAAEGIHRFAFEQQQQQPPQVTLPQGSFPPAMVAAGLGHPSQIIPFSRDAMSEGACPPSEQHRPQRRPSMYQTLPRSATIAWRQKDMSQQQQRSSNSSSPTPSHQRVSSGRGRHGPGLLQQQPTMPASADEQGRGVHFDFQQYILDAKQYTLQQQQQHQQQPQHARQSSAPSRQAVMHPSNLAAITSSTSLPGGISFNTVHGSTMHVTPPETPSSGGIDDTELATSSTRRLRGRSIRVNEDIVTWLRANFEMKPGFTVERRMVYKAYCRHMQSMMQEPTNAAGFGKVIRTVFAGVTSRRLGSRGQSRYHYDGLRIKPSSAVAMLRLADEESDGKATEANAMLGLGGTGSVTSPNSRISQGTLMMLMHSLDKRLQLPGFPHLELEELGVAVTEDNAASLEEDMNSLCQLYRNHCLGMLEAVKSVNFGQAYAMVHAFWSDLPDRLFQLLSSEGVSNKVELWDSILYDTILHVLVPEVLRPVGANANRTISTFVDDLVSSVKSLSDLTRGLPENVLRAKEAAAEVLLEIMQRRMALNSLAQAGMKMLNSESQVEQMRNDLGRVNLKAIKRESAWVTDCPDAFVDRIFAEIMEFLDQPRGLSYASHWLDSIVKRTFKSMVGIDFEAFSLDGSGSREHSSPEHPLPHQAKERAPQAEEGRAERNDGKTQSAHTPTAAKVQPRTGDNQQTPPTTADDIASNNKEDSGPGNAAEKAVDARRRLALEAGKEHVASADDDGHGDATTAAASAEQQRRQHCTSPAQDDAVAQTPASDDSKASEAERMDLMHKTARKLLQAWTFYSSQILRELTVKSAPSFGSCNVLKLLMDEYMYYLIHTRVTHPHKEIVHPDIIVHTTGSVTDSSSQGTMD